MSRVYHHVAWRWAHEQSPRIIDHLESREDAERERARVVEESARGGLSFETEPQVGITL